MKKIIIRDRETNEIVEMGKHKILKLLYSPYANKFLDYSYVFKDILKRYENVPLTRHKITRAERTRIKKNPDAINDIPEWEVKGFDTAVSGKIEHKIREEFHIEFCYASNYIAKFINSTNQKYKAEVVYKK